MFNPKLFQESSSMTINKLGFFCYVAEQNCKLSSAIWLVGSVIWHWDIVSSEFCFPCLYIYKG